MFNLKDLKVPAPSRSSAPASGKAPRAARTIGSAQLRVATGHTYWTHYGTNPKSWKRTAIREWNLAALKLGIDFTFIGSVKRRLGSAGAEGLRGNAA